VRPEAAGDITPSDPGQTNSAIAWAHGKRGSYMQTPIVIGNLLFACTDAGTVTCFDAATGVVKYTQRLSTGSQGFTASPVSDGRHVYFTSEQGVVFVVAAAENYSLVASPELHETCLATPAMADGTLFFRTREKLIAVGAVSAGRD
jgi:outer membrane protein assembly factor BamB